MILMFLHLLILTSAVKRNDAENNDRIQNQDENILKQNATCPSGELWTDGSHLGLGCIRANLLHGMTAENSEYACEAIQEGAHLVEIYNEEQRIFILDFLSRIEYFHLDWEGRWLYWWIGLTDIKK